MGEGSILGTLRIWLYSKGMLGVVLIRFYFFNIIYFHVLNFLNCPVCLQDRQSSVIISER